jgi:hypothetical protein
MSQQASQKPIFGMVPEPNRAPRDTTPGEQGMQQMVEAALQAVGYQYLTDQFVTTLDGHPVKCELKVWDKDPFGGKPPRLVKLVWQEASGSAELKVPFHLMTLAKGSFERGTAPAYMVLGGDGWAWRESWANGAAHPYVANSHLVRIVRLEDFLVGIAAGEL